MILIKNNKQYKNIYNEETAQIKVISKNEVSL